MFGSSMKRLLYIDGTGWWSLNSNSFFLLMGWHVRAHPGCREQVLLPESIESIKKFAVQIGRRFLRSKDLQKASETFRQAMQFQPNDKVRRAWITTKLTALRSLPLCIRCIVLFRRAWK